MTSKLFFLASVVALVFMTTGCKKCPEEREMGEKSLFDYWTYLQTDGRYNGH